GAATVLEDCRSGAIAKEHAGVAIRPINDRRKLLSANNQYGIVRVRRNELLGDLKRVEEAGTGRADVETGGVLRSNLRLNEARRGREEHVRRDRGYNDEIDLLSGNPSILHRRESGFGSQVAGVFAFCGDPPLLDPGP